MTSVFGSNWFALKAQAAKQRIEQSVAQNEHILTLLEQNTRLTEQVGVMSQRIEQLTREVHGKIISN